MFLDSYCSSITNGTANVELPLPPVGKHFLSPIQNSTERQLHQEGVCDSNCKNWGKATTPAAGPAGAQRALLRETVSVRSGEPGSASLRAEEVEHVVLRGCVL